tara:strand:+ start:167 stop:2134 length:1968 start_codon:yes stop_codon:yes gene_type:complete
MPLLSTFGAASARSFGGIGAAAAAEGLDVDEVFNSYLHEGNGSGQTITNNIDLSGEGGLVWLKNRGTGSTNHRLFDTERGVQKSLSTNLSNAQDTSTSSLTAFNSNGFTLSGFNSELNDTNEKYVSWTFRKAPKFFDVQTWTGNDTSGRTISHNLGSVPGCIAVKRTSASDDWTVYHVGAGNTGILQFNKQNAFYVDSRFWNNTTPTATHFTVGDSNNVNASGQTYVAYIWANNNNDGEFGPDSDQDIIKCGSYEGTGNANGPQINLGFEPQWILIKNMDVSSRPWVLIDSMRSLAAQNNDKIFEIDSSNAEEAGQYLDPLPTGFQPISADNKTNDASQTHVYIAIRRGSLKAPVSGADVFGMAQSNRTNSQGDYFQTTAFNVDMHLNMFRDWENGTPNKQLTDRIRGSGNPIYPATTGAEGSFFNADLHYKSNAYKVVNYFQLNSSTKSMHWYWKRAKGYFDIVAGPIASAQMSGPVSYNPGHNLGVVPEMIWVKDRDNTDNWAVYHSALGTSKKLQLDNNGAESSSSWAVAADNFNYYQFGNTTGNAICYLFASVAGVSKVGSFSFSTGGSSTNVTCGFQPRFILLKKYNGTGNWHMFDTSRGIASGNDHRLELDTTDQNNNGFDWVDLISDGFTFNDVMGESNSSYIFYAIA